MLKRPPPMDTLREEIINELRETLEKEWATTISLPKGEHMVGILDSFITFYQVMKAKIQTLQAQKTTQETELQRMKVV